MSWGEKNELWARWRRGESLREISRALHRVASAVYDVVGAEGGIAPRPRRRSGLALTTTEREEISRQLARGRSLRAIGRMLGRPPSTLSREVARNGGRHLSFCDPQSPWQRGSNENTNGLLRQYLPHAVDMTSYSQAQLDAIAQRLNTRPRLTLGYRTPAVRLAEIVASTG
jgi:IS30 family transposase